MSSNTNKQLYFFNPGHENAILNASPYYMPPASIATMQHDLQYLPIWYADAHNYVYTSSLLPYDFAQFIQNNINPTAKIITESNLNESIRYSVHSWGISPQVIHFFKDINTKTGSNLQVPPWNNILKDLSSRKAAQECLIKLQKNISGISENIIPTFFEDLETIENTVKLNTFQLLAKAPFSSSGRGLLWLPIGELTRTERQILHGILKKQGAVSVEKSLDKIIDFAMEFILSPENKSYFTGYSLFKTNKKGAYQGNYLGPQSNIESTITEYIDKELLDQVKKWLTTYLNQNFSPYYEGCVGIDMMIYSEDGNYRLHPCVEINVRDNMGLVALLLSKNYLDKNATGHFYIDFCSNENEMCEKHAEKQEKYPLIISNGRFLHGYFSLCPIVPQTKYRAYILLD